MKAPHRYRQIVERMVLLRAADILPPDLEDSILDELDQLWGVLSNSERADADAHAVALAQGRVLISLPPLAAGNDEGFPVVGAEEADTIAERLVYADITPGVATRGELVSPVTAESGPSAEPMDFHVDGP